MRLQAWGLSWRVVLLGITMLCVAASFIVPDWTWPAAAVGVTCALLSGILNLRIFLRAWRNRRAHR